jgi:hypothetical protein
MEAELTKLKLGPIADQKPIKVTVELPAALHRDLISYAGRADYSLIRTVEHDGGNALDLRRHKKRTDIVSFG